MNAKQIIRDVFVLGVLALFMLALVPGQALAFRPQPEPPASKISRPPAVKTPVVAPRAPSPPVRRKAVTPTMPRSTPPITPRIKTKLAHPPEGPAPGGKLLPGAVRGMDPSDDMPAPVGKMMMPGEAKGAEPLDERAPEGTASSKPGQESEASQFVSEGVKGGFQPQPDPPGPGIILQDKPAEFKGQ